MVTRIVSPTLNFVCMTSSEILIIETLDTIFLLPTKMCREFQSRKLKLGDVGLDFDPDTGKEILVWKAERGSKTGHGDGHQRAFFPTAQVTKNRRCPVTLYKDFASHRPETIKESSFFLAVNNRRSTT